MTNEEIKPYLEKIKKELNNSGEFSETRAFNLLCEFHSKARNEGIKVGLNEGLGAVKRRLELAE